MLGSLFAAILAKATLPADIEVDFSSYEGVWRRYAFVCALPSLGVALLFFFRRNLDRGSSRSAMELDFPPPDVKELLRGHPRANLAFIIDSSHVS